MAGCFIAILNDATFDPASGTQAVAPALVAGPLNPLLANIV